MTARILGLAWVAGVLVALAHPALAAEKEKTLTVENGKTVSIEYTLKLDDGTTADSNVGGEPLKYEQGAEQILPALEKELEGLSVNESKSVTLPAEQGYGPVDPEAFQTVPVDQLPEGAREPGTQLLAVDAAGNRRPVKVKEVRGDEAVLDLNHPLAGETLHFEVKILEIE